MSLIVHPGPVKGTTRAPSSKSVTHRALFLALAERGGTVEAPLWSRDTQASHAAIRALGCKTLATREEIVVRAARPITSASVDADNSGTTLRLATAMAALAQGTSTLQGDESLNRRPMAPLVEALNQLGANARCLGEEGTPPVEVEGPVAGGQATVDASRSSQFVTALLLAAPRMPEGLRLTVEDELASKPYVDLTCRVLEEAGVDVQVDPPTYTVEPHERRAVHVTVPGDYSAAAFPLSAGAATGGRVTVANLPSDTGQGDERLLELLEAFGVEVEREDGAVRVSGRASEPVELDLENNPDLFPPLAALAATVEGTSRLTGAPHLRDKESDRIAAMVEGLQELGVQAEPLEGGAQIQGGILTGGTVDALGDHRVQMAFVVAGLAAQQPVTIEGPTRAHEVSYPNFLEAFGRLGARIEAPPQPESERGGRAGRGLRGEKR